MYVGGGTQGQKVCPLGAPWVPPQKALFEKISVSKAGKRHRVTGSLPSTSLNKNTENFGIFVCFTIENFGIYM